MPDCSSRPFRAKLDALLFEEGEDLDRKKRILSWLEATRPRDDRKPHY